MSKESWSREKNWKHVYTHSEKVHRAQQLGFEYSPATESRIAKNDVLNVLFICSKNQWRSPTAEQIYRQRPLINVRSAGTARSAKRQVSSADIQWADIILVMEDKHKKRLVCVIVAIGHPHMVQHVIPVARRVYSPPFHPDIDVVAYRSIDPRCQPAAKR